MRKNSMHFYSFFHDKQLNKKAKKRITRKPTLSVKKKK